MRLANPNFYLRSTSTIHQGLDTHLFRF